MEENEKCHALTKDGNRCKNFPMKGKRLCYAHRNTLLEEASFECPVCYDCEGTFYTLDCMHSLHRTCLEQLISLECPICRDSLQYLPPDIRNKICANQRQYQEEKISEETSSLQREQIDTLIQDLYRRSIIVRIRREILFIYHYLVSEGIPKMFIPSHVRIEIEPGRPAPQEGFIMLAVLTRIFSRIEEVLGDDEYDDDDEVEEIPDEHDIPHRIQISYAYEE